MLIHPQEQSHKSGSHSTSGFAFKSTVPQWATHCCTPDMLALTIRSRCNTHGPCFTATNGKIPYPNLFLVDLKPLKAPSFLSRPIKERKNSDQDNSGFFCSSPLHLHSKPVLSPEQYSTLFSALGQRSNTHPVSAWA